MINLVYSSNYTDSYTCYKLIRTDILRNLQLESRGFEIEAEISIKLVKMRYNIKEIPINYSPRTIEKGKKIGWKDAVRGVLTIFRYI